MKRNARLIVGLTVCLLPAFASAQYRGGRSFGGGYTYRSGSGGGYRGGYHYGGGGYGFDRRPHSGFNFSLGFGFNNYYNSFGAAGFYTRPFYGNYYYERPVYYRTNSYYVPAAVRYYDDYCYEPYYEDVYYYRPVRYYSRSFYYYEPARPYYPRRFYRYR